MNYETKVDIVASNYSEDFMKNQQTTINKFVKNAFKEGFILGVKKAHKESVEGQKTGTWVESEGAEDGYCSECKCAMPMFIVHWEWKYQKTPYCPNCGAEMKNSVD